MITSPAIFFRVGSLLPQAFHLKQKRFGKRWMLAEDAAPAQLDRAVRNAGWHFLWIDSACSRRGYGRTDESATYRAIARALSHTESRFNAAELGSVRVSRYLGLHIAKATLHTRHLQQNESLNRIDKKTIRRLAPKQSASPRQRT